MGCALKLWNAAPATAVAWQRTDTVVSDRDQRRHRSGPHPTAVADCCPATAVAGSVWLGLARSIPIPQKEARPEAQILIAFAR